MSDLLFFKPANTASNFTRSGSIYPPLGLCQLAAMFPREQVMVMDAEAEALDDQVAQARIESISPKIAMMTASSFTLDIVEQWASWFKYRDIPVIVGGPHPTLLPEDFFRRCPSVDLAVRGEAELVLPSLVGSIFDSRPPESDDCCLRLPSGELHISKTHRVRDFSSLPFPSFSELDMTKYWCPDARLKPLATMMTARGCNQHCTFCSTPAIAGRKPRGWSPEQVVEELWHLCQSGIREVSFLDDGFTSDRQRAISICHGILKAGIGLSWFCNARADCLDDELVRTLADAGCHQIYLGLESGSEEILRKIQKRLTVDQMKRGTALLRRYGIGVSAGFVIGFPGETRETVDQTISLAWNLKPDRIQFSRFLPLPGSTLCKTFKNYAPTSFHDRGQDQTGQWIDEAYRQCCTSLWGQPSL